MNQPLEAKPFVYVPVTDKLVQLGLYLTGSGTNLVKPGDAYPNQAHPELYDFSWKSGRVLPEYQFVFITDGQGEFESEQTGKIKVTPGTMMVLFPGVWHTYRPSPQTGWTEYWISVNGDLIFDWNQRGILNPDDPVHQFAQLEVLVRQYTEILRLLTEHPRYQPATVSARVLMIITQLLDQLELQSTAIRKTEEEEFSSVVTAAKTEIWNHSHWQLSVAMLAERVGVARRTLERKFAAEVGHTVHAELTRCRLDRAKRMLSETQVPIKSVAYASGFSSVANMSRVFRRELDTTPTDYRVIHQQVSLPATRRILQGKPKS